MQETVSYVSYFLNRPTTRALGQKSGTKIKVVFQDSVAPHQKSWLPGMNAIHIEHLWSKCCSPWSKVSAAILELVSAAEIMVRTKFQPISSATFQSFFSKPVHFWIPAFLVNLLLGDTPKILDRMKLRDSKRGHLYAGWDQNGRFCPCPFHKPSFAYVHALAYTQDVWFPCMPK